MSIAALSLPEKKQNAGRLRLEKAIRRLARNPLNPKLDVSGKVTRMFPLDIAAAPRSVVGEKIGDLPEKRDKIVAALDLLFARD